MSPSFPPDASPRTPDSCCSAKPIGGSAWSRHSIPPSPIPGRPNASFTRNGRSWAQRLFALAAGYEDLNDHQRLRNDPLWQAATDHPEIDDSTELASPPTLCRLENRITRSDLVRLTAVLVDQFIASFPTPPTELTLDIDATDDLIHGNQEKNFFHGYYDHHCFLPLYVTCSSRLLVAYLRPSNIGADHHARVILKLLVMRLRQAWPDVKILIRGDGGFGR